MKAPGKPPNEDERLAALRDLAVLDAAPGAHLDEITRHAAQLLDVKEPIETWLNEAATSPTTSVA